MSNRIQVKLSYDKTVLVNAEDLPKLMNILEGAHIVDYGYVDGEQVHYLKDDDYHLEFGPTHGGTYVSEDRFRELCDEAATRKALEEQGDAA